MVGPGERITSNAEIKPLTRRETEIAVLLVRGYSNRRIAEELVIATPTVERHVANILAKLTVNSRTEIAVWAVDHGLTSAANQQSDATRNAPGVVQPDLPAELNSLIGREADLRELRSLLDSTRLLTLTGAGGIGKTRLALSLARQSLRAHSDGVCFVPLEALSDRALVGTAIASALRVREQSERSLLHVLANAVGSRDILLLLDSCEHLIDECAETVEYLLGACARLQVLATSRESMNIPPERVWPVSPLRLPPEGAVEPVEVLDSPAVRLFLDRLRAKEPHFVLDTSNAAAVARINRRLDGLPLAIELAAAQAGLLNVHDLERRLADSQEILAKGWRTAPPRQQSVRATVAWSYELLPADAQRLFARLAIFSGGCTLEAAEQLCCRNADTQQFGGVLHDLVAKSLVQMDNRMGETTRYRMLETVRQYACERLVARSEYENMRSDHAHFFLRLFEPAFLGQMTAQQPWWHQRLLSEHDNLRAALAWALEYKNADVGLRLGAVLFRFWVNAGYLTEGEHWLTRLLDELEGGGLARSRVLFGAGMLAFQLGKDDVARLRFEALRPLATQVGDTAAISGALTHLGYIARRQGNLLAARRFIEESVAIRREMGDKWGLIVNLAELGRTAMFLDDLASARTLCEESVDLARAAGVDNVNLAGSLNTLGFVHLNASEWSAAYECFVESLQTARGVGTVQSNDTLLGMARLAAQMGEFERAVRLLGATVAHRDATGLFYFENSQRLIDNILRTARQVLGASRFRAAWRSGVALSLAEAVTVALEPAESGLVTLGPRLSNVLNGRTGALT